VFSCLGLSSLVFPVLFGLFLCSLGRLVFVLSFVSKGFPYEDHIEESFIVLASFCVFQTRSAFNSLVIFSFNGLDTVLFEGTISC